MSRFDVNPPAPLALSSYGREPIHQRAVNLSPVCRGCVVFTDFYGQVKVSRLRREKSLVARVCKLDELF